MSSGTPFDPHASQIVTSLVGGALEKGTMERIGALGMSPRQRGLNHLWSWYRTQQYDARSCDWNGHPVTDALETEAIASAGYLPPGFYDAGGQTLPLRFRRPSTPYHIVKLIVDRFSGMLFSERHHPQVKVAGDLQTEGYVGALLKACRFWSHMSTIRTLGGAMGTFCAGFKFIDGQPVIEVHDPRWMFPDFQDKELFKLNAIEKRYQFPVEMQDAKGKWHIVWYWYRRYIDGSRDVLFRPAPVGRGDEPAWVVQEESVHGFGFCPVVWGQNLPVIDDIDGDPDCQGVYEIAERIDALLSQAVRGTVQNCDPTLVISTKDDLKGVKKGSDNAIKLSEGSADYLEINGAGPKAALDAADQLRERALEIAQCVVERPGAAAGASGGTRTATEVERAYESMFAKVDVLREQYGECLVKPLLGMMLSAIRIIQQPVLDPETGVTVVGEIVLPPRVESSGGEGTETISTWELGPGGVLDLRWGPYVQPSPDDALRMVQAAAQASAAGLIDKETAATALAPFFKVEDIPAMLKKLRKEAQEAKEALDAQMALGMAPPPAPPGGPTGLPLE